MRILHLRVDLTHKDTGEVLSIGHDGSIKIDKRTNSNPNPDDQIDKTLYVKDKFNVSNQTYHELAMINKDLPGSSVLTKRARELDSESNISPTPGKLIGVQQSLQERLKKRIQHLVGTNPTIAEKRMIKVKIITDGTCISRSMHAIVIAFTIIEDEASPNSPRGNHSIALLNAEEN